MRNGTEDRDGLGARQSFGLGAAVTAIELQDGGAFLELGEPIAVPNRTHLEAVTSTFLLLSIFRA
ncbi:hypothetical protein VQ03_27370 [Methylobacterium tarhaniae]|uniref:Uncharacterized protein n=1 Tax=Methylobacterium tarhaniae TaxID=1187852 RepID=A0A0J6S7W1_9HYPH|nr:hypothetical protein VQ03_27370 [Methylobacterium tarhaniae]